jgi:hypothetical protein
VLLCYAEDRAPGEVARQLGIPAATVRSRLKRGLEELRRRMEARDGAHGKGIRAWSLAVGLGMNHAPGGPTPWLGSAKGVLVMKTKIAAVTAALAVIAALLGVARWSTGARPAADRPGQVAVGRHPGRAASVARAAGERSREEVPASEGEYALSGHVLDAGGGVIPGARITVFIDGRAREGRAGDEARPALTGKAGGDGGYRLMLPQGRHDVLAEADGYAPRRATVVVVDHWRQDFRLQPAARIAGRVLRKGTGAPVVGAKVRADSGRIHADATTDGDGAFTLAGLESGDYGVVAVAGPLVGRAVRPVGVGVAEQVDGIVIALSPGRLLTGVVRRRGGAVVADARVQLSEATPFAGVEPRVRGEARSAADGGFRIEGVLAGSYSLTAEAQGLARGAQRIVVVEDDVEGVQIEVLDTAALHGRVVDREGRAAADVLVRATVTPRPLLPAYEPFGPVRTDREGHFALEYLQPGVLSVVANDPVRGSAVLDAGAIAAGEDREVELKLQGGGVHIRGRVSWDDGKAAPGVMVVSGSAIGWGANAGTSAVTDAEGRYSLGPFGVGLLVFVNAEESGGWENLGLQRQAGHPVRIERAEDITGIDFTLARADARIAGVVTGPDGLPVGGAVVFTRPGRAGVRVLTDDEGHFRFDVLPNESYVVRAEHPGLPPAQVAGVAPGTMDVRVQMQKGATIVGQVVRPSGDAPGPFTVWAQVARGPRDREPARVVLEGKAAPAAHQWLDGRDGRFELRELAPGRYDVVALTVSGASASAVGIVVEAGQTRRDVVLELGEGVTVTGRLVSLEDRSPLAGVTVRVSCEGHNQASKTDATGGFRVDAIARGVHCQADAEAAGFVGLSRTFDGPVDRAALELGAIPLLPERLLHKNTGRVGMMFSRNEAGDIVVLNAGPTSPAGRRGWSAAMSSSRSTGATSSTPTCSRSSSWSVVLRGRPCAWTCAAPMDGRAR